ncbi:ABC transporter permease, partial [Mesorhizobium sp. M0488]
MTDLAQSPMRGEIRLSWAGRLRRLVPEVAPSTAAGSAVLLFWVVCALFGSRFVPFDPYAEDFLAMMTPPDAVHWFGTDQLGRDVLSRIVVGSRDILLVAPLATLAGVIVG